MRALAQIWRDGSFDGLRLFASIPLAGVPESVVPASDRLDLDATPDPSRPPASESPRCTPLSSAASVAWTTTLDESVPFEPRDLVLFKLGEKRVRCASSARAPAARAWALARDAVRGGGVTRQRWARSEGTPPQPVRSC